MNTNFATLGQTTYGTNNLYLNPKYIKAHKLLEKYQKEHPNYYFDLEEIKDNGDTIIVTAYPLSFLSE